MWKEIDIDISKEKIFIKIEEYNDYKRKEIDKNIQISMENLNEFKNINCIIFYHKEY